jgi:hypothetical protein
MILRTLACPACGAPLRLSDDQRQTLCLYCGSTVTIAGAGASERPEVKTGMPPEALEQVKQLLVEGRQAEAVQLYQRQAGVSEAEARETLKTLVGEIARRTIVRQPISNLGIALMLIIDTLGLALMLWGWQTDTWLAVAGGLGLIVFESLAFASALLIRIRYEMGAPAPAVVRRFVRVGELNVAGQPEPIQIVRLWLEVRPSSQPSFKVEKNVAMRKQSLAQLVAGVVIEVRHARSGDVIPVAPIKVLEMSAGVVG